MQKSVSSVDLRPRLSPACDQGQRPTCLAFAVTAGHEVGRAVGGSVEISLSEEVLYWGGRKIKKEQGRDSAGLTFAAAEQALSRWGQPETSLWPYDGNRNEDGPEYDPPAAAIAQSNCFPAELLSIAVRLDAILARLRAQEAVVIGLQLSDQFFYTNDGWLVVPHPADIIPDAHAVLLVGFEETGPGLQDGHFIFRNSWGEDWGDHGYGYMPFEYVMKYALRACAIEPRNWPTSDEPRKTTV